MATKKSKERKGSNREQVVLRFRKGVKGAVQKQATAAGVSLNSFIESKLAKAAGVKLA